MAEWDSDFSALSGIGAGMQGFAKGLMDMEDRKYRKMEMEAKAKAQEDDRKRQRFQDALDLRHKGFKVPEGGEGGQIYDTDPTKLEYDPEYIKMKNAQSSAAADPFGLKGLQAQKLQNDVQQDAFKKSPQGKIEGLAGDQRKRFDDVTGSLDAVRDLKEVYSGFSDPSSLKNKSQMMSIPLRGDTPYTAAANRFTEFLGRMQSGGAIGEKEAAGFKQLIPTAFDSPEIAKSKLSELEYRLGARIKGFGVETGDVEQLGFLKTRKGLVPGGLVKGKQPSADVQKKMSRLQELEAKAAKGG